MLEKIALPVMCLTAIAAITLGRLALRLAIKAAAWIAVNAEYLVDAAIIAWNA